MVEREGKGREMGIRQWEMAHSVDPCGLHADECLAWSERRLRDSAEGELVERTSLFESKRLHGRITMIQTAMISVWYKKKKNRVEIREVQDNKRRERERIYGARLLTRTRAEDRNLKDELTK